MPNEHTPKKPREQYRLRTRLIHGSFATGRWDHHHHVVPPQSSSATYRLSSVHRGAQGFVEFATPESRRAPIYIYDRLDEPSRGMREENLAAPEGGEVAVTFATGMAAVSGTLGVLTATGDQIVAHPILYGCTHSLLTSWLPRYKIRTDFCDLTKPESLVKVAMQNCRALYLETRKNPAMELIDLRAIRQVVDRLNEGRAEAEKIRIVVDHTFATPYCQRPLQHSVDVVVHSLTKDIGGFGTEMGGAVIGSGTYFNLLMLHRKDFGGVRSSQECVADPGAAGSPSAPPASASRTEKRDAGGGIFAAAARGAACGLSGAGKLRAARTGAPSDDHTGRVLRARPHAVF
jgi:methionine-gamma-lyase